MCGIAGCWPCANRPSRVDEVLAELAHRGPDGHGAYVDAVSGVTLVHARLAIIDLSEAGHQPMTSRDGKVTIAFNGEIYNFRELAAELEAGGVVLRGHSDTEVLLDLYLRDGLAMLPRLNGMFAFAIHDTRSGELLLARDGLGVKPLYVCEDTGGFVFASEIKASLPWREADSTLDLPALQRYLAFLWCPGTGTPFANVRKLAPGHAMVVKDGRVAREWRWYELPLRRGASHIASRASALLQQHDNAAEGDTTARRSQLAGDPRDADIQSCASALLQQHGDSAEGDTTARRSQLAGDPRDADIQSRASALLQPHGDSAEGDATARRSQLAGDPRDADIQSHACALLQQHGNAAEGDAMVVKDGRVAREWRWYELPLRRGASHIASRASALLQQHGNAAEGGTAACRSQLAGDQGGDVVDDGAMSRTGADHQSRASALLQQHDNAAGGDTTACRSQLAGDRTCIDAVREALRTAVRRQLVADVPVGAFLSGGLDSSAVVAFAREQAPDIRCFTIEQTGGGDTGDASDLPYAQRVAKHLGVQLDVVRIDAAQMARGLTDMVWQLDEPLADPAPLNVLYISRLAHTHGIKVLLSGAGGDDLFTGYRRHVALRYERWWRWLPPSAQRGLGTLAGRLDQRSAIGRRLGKLLSGIDVTGDEGLVRYFAWTRRADLLPLLSADFRRAVADVAPAQPMLDYLAGMPADATRLQRMLALEQRFFLADHNLDYTDKMAMAAGVEVRVPFLDPDLMELAARIPDRYLQHGRTGKWVLKKAMEPYLPHDVIYRPKTGFGAPLRRWMRHELRELLGDVLSEASLRKRGLFDSAAVQRLIADNDAGRKDAAYTLLSLLCIEIWCRRFLDRSGV